MTLNDTLVSTDHKTTVKLVSTLKSDVGIKMTEIWNTVSEKSPQSSHKKETQGLK